MANALGVQVKSQYPKCRNAAVRIVVSAYISFTLTFAYSREHAFHDVIEPRQTLTNLGMACAQTKVGRTLYETWMRKGILQPMLAPMTPPKMYPPAMPTVGKRYRMPNQRVF